MSFDPQDRLGNQDPAELTRFLAFVKRLKVRRYLEIGCRNGTTFFAVMRIVGKGGFGLAIDLPENADTRASLSGAAQALKLIGVQTEILFGNSSDRSIISRAHTYSPFDLILIDADHTYEGVKRDWDNYSRLAPVTALHDVDAPDDHMSDEKLNGVGKFWRELKQGRVTQEIVTPGSNMGFGIVL